MTPRDYGTGSIVPRGKAWQIRWYEPPDPVTGVRRRRALTLRGVTKREASAELAKRANQTSADTRAVTVAELIERWRATATHELGTKRNYDQSTAKLPAAFAATPIGDVRVETVDAVYRALLAAGTSRHRVRNMHAMLSAAFTQACRWGWLRDHPVRYATAPTIPRKRRKAPTSAEIVAVLEQVTRRPVLDVWIRLAAALGARPSEVLAVRWCDIVITEHTVEREIDGELVAVVEFEGWVHVAEALDPIDRHRKPTKEHDVRDLAIGHELCVRLLAWKRAAVARASAVGIALADDALVLSDAVDSMTPWRQDTTTRRFRKMRVRAGVGDHVRLHDVRHFVGTELMTAFDVRHAAEHLGHSDVATTGNVYGDTRPERKRAAANHLEALIRSNPAA